MKAAQNIYQKSSMTMSLPIESTHIQIYCYALAIAEVIQQRVCYFSKMPYVFLLAAITPVHCLAERPQTHILSQTYALHIDAFSAFSLYLNVNIQDKEADAKQPTNAMPRNTKFYLIITIYVSIIAICISFHFKSLSIHN